MKRIVVILFITLIVIGSVVSRSGASTLFDWSFKFNETTYESLFGTNPPSILPSNFDYSGFDWDSGLGTITVDGFVAGGSNTFHAFFDHEIDEPLNTFFNEYGSVSGTPAPGQTWEIDEPGFGTPHPNDPMTNPAIYIGDIYNNFSAGSLDNQLYFDGFTNDFLSDFQNPVRDDVSMAMGWGFTLNPDETAMITLVLGMTQPTSGFYLLHTDPDSSETIYFSGNLGVRSAAVPEPGTLLLVGTGIMSLAALRCRFRL